MVRHGKRSAICVHRRRAAPRHAVVSSPHQPSPSARPAPPSFRRAPSPAAATRPGFTTSGLSTLTVNVQANTNFNGPFSASIMNQIDRQQHQRQFPGRDVQHIGAGELQSISAATSTTASPSATAWQRQHRQLGATSTSTLSPSPAPGTFPSTTPATSTAASRSSAPAAIPSSTAATSTRPSPCQRQRQRQRQQQRHHQSRASTRTGSGSLAITNARRRHHQPGRLRHRFGPNHDRQLRHHPERHLARHRQRPHHQQRHVERRQQHGGRQQHLPDAERPAERQRDPGQRQRFGR